MDKPRLIGEGMGLDFEAMSPDEQRSAFVNTVTGLGKAICLGQTLSKVGARRGDVPELAEKAMEDVCIVTNPRRVTRLDIEALFEGAF